MTTELQSKLRQILLDLATENGWNVGPPEIDVTVALARIDLAYQDAGYIVPKEMHPLDLAHELGFMTGQEFYDRFEADIAGMAFPLPIKGESYVIRAIDRCKLAAKRAAGLK